MLQYFYLDIAWTELNAFCFFNRSNLFGTSELALTNDNGCIVINMNEK